MPKLNTTQRCFNIIEALAGNELRGITNQEIAATLAVPPSTSFRDLNLLIQEGVVQRHQREQNRYVLTTRFVATLRKIDAGIAEANYQYNDLKHNYGVMR